MGGFAEEASGDDADEDGEEDFGAEQHAALFEDVGRGFHFECCAEAYKEHGQEGCQAGEECAGEGPEEFSGVRSQGVDDGADAQGHQHHAAGDFFQEFPDGNRH
jgi:hypothetical protein